MNEISAIQQCKQGDLNAFTDLYDQYVDPIYRFIFYKTHHRETTEDLTSQTFMKAMDKIGGFNPDKASFKTWLYTIARNTVIDHYRTVKESSPIEDAWDIGVHPDMDAETDAILELEKIKNAMQKLNPEQREVVMLRVWSDKSFREIAEITGKTEAACKMSFKRTVEKLGKNIALLPLFYSLLN